jgi:prevent-host-death family protein
MKHKTKEVGLFDAKTRLSALVARVQRGEEIIITKHGSPVARLVPAVKPARPPDPREAVARIRELRRGLMLGKISLRSLIEEGRL